MSGRPNAVDGGVFEASERPAVVADLLHIFDSWKSMELNEARECLEGRMRSMEESWKHLIVADFFQVFDSGCPEGRMRSMEESWKHLIVADLFEVF